MPKLSLFPHRDQAVTQHCPQLWDQGEVWAVTLEQYGGAPGTTPRALSLVCPTSGLGCSSGRQVLRRSQGKELKKRLKEEKVTGLLWDKTQAREETTDLPNHVSNYHNGKTGHIDRAE